MADIQPFRAVRYAGAAGALADLVAPPYDAVDDEEREALYTRSPYNVVHVTLPESAGDAGRLYREWLARGVLVQDDEPAVWLAVEDFVGPDGVARERRGVIVSVAAAPYAEGTVLPHERTHPRIREERRRLLDETRVQPEPILLLADATLALSVPDEPADIQVDGTRLWRRPAGAVDGLRNGQLLIADGHHRYESAVELGEELGAALRIMALVVPTDDAGLELFPTHRFFVGRPDAARGSDDEAASSLEDALTRLEDATYESSPRSGIGRATSVSVTARRVSSTSSSSTATASTASGTRHDWTKRWPPSTLGQQMPRSSFVGLGSRTSLLRLEAAGACLRRARTSIRSLCLDTCPSRDDVTAWLETCRLCVADIRGVLARLPTRIEREPVLQRGVGGDNTTAIDQAAEDAVVERLAALGVDFVLVSEELGERVFGSGGATRVVVDPIDGSVNAKAQVRSSRSRSRSPRARRWET